MNASFNMASLMLAATVGSVAMDMRMCLAARF